VWTTKFEQTAVSCEGDFSLAPAYIRGVRCSEMLWAVWGKLVADVSGVTTDPFSGGEKLLGAWKGVDILSPKFGNLSPEFDTWRPERGSLLISIQLLHEMDFVCSFISKTVHIRIFNLCHFKLCHFF